MEHFDWDFNRWMPALLGFTIQMFKNISNEIHTDSEAILRSSLKRDVMSIT